MDDFLLQLELFWRPGMTGALLALLLPCLGLYLRLRQEYWAALAYGQLGAAGALGALALGVSPLAGGIAASLSVAGMKHWLEKCLPPAGLFPLLFIFAWGLGLLLSANLPHVERLGAALFEGQLYFAGVEMSWSAVVAVAAGGLFLRRAGRSLLLARLCPAHFHAQRFSTWPVRLGFDLLVAASLALAVMSLGVMGAFALVFIPPWLVFALAPGWRVACVAAPVLSLAGYTLAFALALACDQPFGPTLALVLAGMSMLCLLGHCWKPTNITH